TGSGWRAPDRRTRQLSAERKRPDPLPSVRDDGADRRSFSQNWAIGSRVQRQTSLLPMGSCEANGRLVERIEICFYGRIQLARDLASPGTGVAAWIGYRGRGRSGLWSH